MNVPANISAMESVTINRRNYTVVGRPESTGDGFWRLALVPVDIRPRELPVAFAKVAEDGTFMGWTRIRRPKLGINMVRPVEGRDYRFVSDLALMSDGFWHASLSAVDQLPGEKDRIGRFRSNGECESVTE